MYVSDYTFDHLRQAADERFDRELELRRIVREREAEHAPAARGGLRRFVQHLRHPGWDGASARVSHP